MPSQPAGVLAVASPKYLASHGMSIVPADLHHHRCINWRYQGTGAVYRWEFEKKGKSLEMGVQGPLISNEQDVVLEAALQGLGDTRSRPCEHSSITCWTNPDCRLRSTARPLGK
jgi:DNA-binding transcriptional LysR family regulator